MRTISTVHMNISIALSVCSVLMITFSLLPISASAFIPSPLEGRRRSISNLRDDDVQFTQTQLFHHDQNSSSNNDNDRRSFLASSASAALSFPAILSASTAANAITPEQASKSYDTYAATYDNLDGGSVASSLGIDQARKNLVAQARGDVLEIGVGTGLNLESYRFGSNGNDGNKIKSLTLVDISEGMLSQAKLRIDQMKTSGVIDDGVAVQIVQADATSELIKLFGENKFDTVVDTFSLCVMGNEGAKKCLEEITGVVKKAEDGGRILLIENTRASNPLLGAYQDITASAAADVGGKGCVYNQNVGEMIERTKGLKLAKEEAFAGGFFRSFTCQKL